MPEGQQALGLLEGLTLAGGGWGSSWGNARASQSSMQQLYSWVILHRVRGCIEAAGCASEQRFAIP